MSEKRMAEEYVKGVRCKDCQRVWVRKMSNEEAIKLILEIKSIKHTDTMRNRRIDEALDKAIEILKDKIETEEKQSNW